MADVDLLVEVRQAGVDSAANSLKVLEERGLAAGRGMTALARATDRAFAAVGAASARQKGTTDALLNADAATKKLAASTDQLRSSYQRFGALNPGMTAAERLTNNLGVTTLRGGMDRARKLAAQEAALNADPIRDMMMVEREQMELSQARTRALTAQGQVANAVWERQLAAMKPVEAAQARLTKATQELAVATRLANLANTAVGRNPTTENYNRQAEAANRLAAAQRGLLSSQQGLVTAQNGRTANDGNAFQSSYSYFILAGLATQASQAIFGVGQAGITASSEIERSFADIRRTTEGTEGQLESLRLKLREISGQGPISLIDLSEIATLGNQLGVAAEDIEGFTETISQYSAVSGQSAENSATAFGRISNLTGLAASQYSNLASAITYVARTTVATESTIQNTAKEITALSAGAGFSAEAIVGLAGALSSLAIPPERARGALSLYFGALNSAVSEGGPKLQAFALLTGKTADELENLVRQNRGQEVFTAFISGLSELDTVAKSTALDTLGLSTIRVDQTMRALSQNVPLVTSSLAGAKQAFDENVEISNQYAVILDTLDSRWKTFQNAVQNAAGALGDRFADSAKDVLVILTNMLVEFDRFATSPLGEAFLRLATGVGLVVGALAALLGMLALAKASTVVLSFAIRQMEWTTATAGIKGWAAALLSSDATVRASARSQGAFVTALQHTKNGITATTLATKGLTVALNVLKIALPILAITAAIALWDSMATAIDKAINPSKTLADDLTGLKDALLTDNPRTVADEVDAIGTSGRRAMPNVSDFNKAILAAIEVQERASGALNETTEKIDDQKFALGDASKAWIADALKTQDQIADILDGDTFEDVVGYLFDGISGSARRDITPAEFKKLILGGLDVNKIAQIAVTEGRDSAIAAYESFRAGYESANPGDPLAAQFLGDAMIPAIDSVIDAYEKGSFEAALFGIKTEEAGRVAVATEAEFMQLAQSGDTVAATFSGITNKIDDFRSAVQGAISGSVSFGSVLEKAQEAAEALAEAQGGEAKPITATGFGSSLQSGIDDAVKFYEEITALADTGNTSFALQLAELGPEAQSILSSSLDLDAGDLGKLEAASRFAAFIASDAFKNALEANMVNSNEAYARIFRETGDLGEVRKLIAAEIAGPEALQALEAEWAISHPNLPLNITPELSDPTPEQLKLYSDKLSGRIVIKPLFGPSYNGAPQQIGQQVTDTSTGASITLSAGLDEKVLAASVAQWSKNQYKTPAEIAAELNHGELSGSLSDWVSNNGPVTIPARIAPVYTDSFQRLLTNGVSVPVSVRGDRSRGGNWATGGEIPAFASGGSWGQFRGPGSGTSDSILARVSAGEYINTADSTKFWGPDFFDSLNRKMLPASFMKMLGAAAVSGNSGPQSVTNVSVTQVNPVTRNPLKQLKEDSENLVTGLWGRG